MRPICRSGFRSAELADDKTAVERDDAIGERQQFVDLLRDQQNGASAVAKLGDLSVDEGDACDVDPPRRLRGDQQLRLPVQFAGDDDALLIASGEAAGGVGQAP